jgi:hypothetical protein
VYIEAKRRPLFLVNRVLTQTTVVGDRVTLDMGSILPRTPGRANEQETSHEVRHLL